MARQNLSALVRYLRQLVRSTSDSGASDAELLERYVRRRDEAAFELLLWRHGALVFNVCRRLLPSEQDAEDAFQATFLTFVRKAGSIGRRGSVASWLYKVAYRVALKAKERLRKTAAAEQAGDADQAVASVDDPLWSDVRPILDAELNRLPEHLRRPIVLCYLEGKSNAEASRELGCPLGTIYSRLSRGREMLRQRLQHRGMTLPAAALTAVLTARAVEAVPAISLVWAAARAALAFADPSAAAAVSPRVAALAEGVLRTMFVTKLKIAAVMLLVIGVAAGGVWTQAGTAVPQTRSISEGTPPKPAGGDKKKDAEPIAVKVVKPKKGGMGLMVMQQARVAAAQQQQIVPLISGTVKEVSVNIGDRVKKGQTLIILDAPLLDKEVEEAMASLELAQAQVDEAKAVVEETEKLVLDKLASASGPHKARASLKAARAKAKLAQVALEKARIQASNAHLKAAFDGVVTRRTIDPGNYVQASDSRLLRPLLTVQQIDRVCLSVGIGEDHVSLIRVGLPVEIHRPAVGWCEHKISRFSPMLENVNPAACSMTVEIDVPNSDQRLLPGMSALVKLPLNKTSPNSLIVPSACVLWQNPRSKQWPWVYVVRFGRACRKNVTTGFDDDRSVEITEGIQASDLIITENQEKLSENTPVKIEKVP